MSRMTTSCASLSWAMPAIRRACSSGVRAGMLAAVEAESLDELLDRGRNEALDRLASRDAVADLARRDRKRFDLEEQHAFRPAQPFEHAVESLARISRARSNSESRPFQYLVR